MGNRLVGWIAAFSFLSLFSACGGGGGALSTLPGGGGGGGGTLPGAPSLSFQAQLPSLDGVPVGVDVAFVGDVVTLHGADFTAATKVFLGLNIDLAGAPDSLLTTAAASLPSGPFTYVDPVTSQATILEVEASVEFFASDELRVTVPAAVACHSGFTNPIVRLVNETGSSDPEADVIQVVGPRLVGLTPNRGGDFGGYSVAIHGDFFSPYTQVAVRFPDPVTGDPRTVGNAPDSDIVETFVNRNTILVPAWPGAVQGGGAGLTADRSADVLLFESIDAINGSAALEPQFGGVAPCDPLLPESPQAPLQFSGVRNAVVTNAFTYLAGGVLGFPVVFGVTPGSGPETGGNTIVLTGDNFDAFTADLSDASDPGAGVECPPGSG
ncbi:MAG: hypothetical protein ACREQ9_27245, partial [Candidatus Binatia bacterium]